ncbi:RHS repeat-associated protein [Ruminiclostridium sufflavum DSM 19573]|uniref:cellulase n=1 Tax=Ruminiclostridium sufflavum DSM 19573 TaxID=1121337 RepID=A0A318XJT3_9FIRM|nr:RHS repeat-associated core domain-containing protein [Ruminiclostridium sufflavum]PYG87269.1 RHS repeat-associated protein [Ruminiclostridium sufflavum DSM 19573]
MDYLPKKCMRNAKRRIAGLLAMLLAIQSLCAFDLSAFQVQKAFAGALAYEEGLQPDPSAEKESGRGREADTGQDRVTAQGGDTALAGASDGEPEQAGMPKEAAGMMRRVDSAASDLPASGSQATAFASAVTTPAAVSIPANINVTASDTALTVSWDAADGADSYDLWTDGSILNTTEVSYTYSGLEPGTPHTIRLRAVSQYGTGDWSAEISAYTLLNTPLSLAAALQDASAELSWSAVSGAAYYEIYRNGTVIGTSVTSTYSDSGLTAGTACVYRIKAYSSTGNTSALSEALEVSMSSATVTPAAISVPSNIIVTSTDTTLTVGWDAVEGANSYYVSLDGNITKTTANNYTYNGLEPNTQHTIKVRAVDPDMYGLIGDVNGDNAVDAIDMALVKKYLYDNTFDFPVENDMWIGDVNGDDSIDAIDYALMKQYFLGSISDFPKSLSEWSEEVTRYTLLSAPANLTAVPSAGTVALTWDSVTGAEGYEVYRDGSLLEDSNTNSYSDSGLMPGETYQYAIKAYNEHNESAMSNQAAVTTIAPSVPANIKVEATDTTLSVSWTSVEEAESYDISFDGNITNVTACSHAYNGLEPNTQHAVKVRTVDNAGTSGNWSTEIISFTRFAAPANFAATTVSAVSIDLTWNEVNGAAGYDVKIDNEIIPDITGNTYQITGLAPGLKHWISIRAKNPNTESAWSGEISKYTLLSTPSNIIVTAATTSLTVSWDAVSDATSYDVELNGQTVKTVTQNSCVIDGLTVGTQYRIRIKALNDYLSSDWSNEVSNTTQAYTNVSGTISRNTTWTLANSPYMMEGSVTIAQGATLTIEPGVVVKGAYYSYIIDVRGKLIANGDVDNPIVFTTHKDSEYGGSGVKGLNDYWQGINVSETGEFVGDNVKIRYSDSSYTGAIIVRGKLKFTNSAISNSYGHGVFIDTSNDVIIEGNTISQKANGIEISKLGTGNLSIKNNGISNNEPIDSAYSPILINIGGVNSSAFEKIQNNTYSGYMRCNGIMIKGTLSENFTLNSGTYYIHSDLIVPSGKTLIVNQGVIIKRIDGYSNIYVNGVLQANGATDNPVVFTTYGDIVYGGNIEAPIYCGSIKISETGEFIGENIKIRYGAANSENTCALSVCGKLTITNSEIISSCANTRETGQGIYTNTTKDITIENTLISGFDYGIFAANNSEASNGTITIINNTISDCNYEGITFSQKGAGNVIIEDNNLVQNSWGISVFDFGIGNLSIQNNSIEYNSTSTRAHAIYVNLGVKESIFTSIKNNTYTGSVFKSIEIGGTLADNLTITSGTYYFLEDISVPEGLTLTIKSGVILKNANQSYGIKVQGTLDASSGTRDNPIVFTTEYDSAYGGNGIDGYWYGIYVSSTGTFNGNSVKIRYGGYHTYIITYNDSALKVEGKFILTNSEIVRSHQYGIYFNTSDTPVLLFNTFYGNGNGGDKNRYGIYNANPSTPIDARYNYWGSYYGPSVYDSNTGKWVGEGDRVGDGIDYTPWLGSEMNYKLYFGQSGTNSATGNFSRTYTDLTMDSPGFDISFSRTYNSRNDKASVFGRGWTFSYEGSVKNAESTYVDIDGTTKTTAVPSTKVVSLPDGSVQAFKENEDGTYTANNSRNTLVKRSDGTYTLTSKEQNVFYFNQDGCLVKMEDRNGNAITITVDSEGKATAVKDQADRQFAIAYQDGLIKTITDIAGSRTITYNYQNQRLTEVIDAMGNSTGYLYDTDGFLTEIRDSSNKTVEAVTYLHSGENKDKVDTRTDANGNILTYSYDNINCKTTITDSSGRVTAEKYDSAYSIISSTDAEEKLTAYEYDKDSSGLNKYAEQKSVTDRNGSKTSYDRDSKGNITKVTNPDSSTRVMTYDAKNNVTSVRDEMGKYTFFVYDASQKKLLKKVQPLNGTEQYTDGTSDASKFAITTYTYYTDAECQANGYKAKALLKSVRDAESKTTTYTYDAYGNIKTVTDAENKTVTTQYNSISQLLKSISAKGNETEYTYDKNGNLEKQEQKNGTGGSITRITYDSENRRTKEVAPKQYNAAEDDIASHEYTGNYGNRYTYYDSGKVKTFTDANNYTTSYTYDIYGNLKTEEKPNGSVYTYEYDVMNRAARVYYQDSPETGKIMLEENTYEILANKNTQTTSKKYLNGTDIAVTVSVYDYSGRLISKTNPDGTTSTAYNANGTINNTTDAKGSKAYYKYDGLNRLTEQWTPFESISGTVKYTYQKIVYDKAGRKLQEIAGKTTVTLYSVPTGYIANNYEYYANGKVKTLTQSDETGTIFGKTEYEYDADGNISKEAIYTDANNKNITEYGYNYLGKVSEKKVHVKAGDIEGNDYTGTEDTILSTLYTYDKNGSLETITTPDGVTTTYTYDNMNLRTSVSQSGIDEYMLPVTITSSTEYDWQGNTVKTTDPNGNETINTYSKRGLLEKTVTETTASAGLKTTNTTAFYYDRAGRLTAEVAAKDYDPAKTLEQMNRVEYTYDLMGRVKTKTYIGGEKRVDPTTFEWTTGQVNILQRAYKYDANGNVIKELDALGFEAATDKTGIDTQIDTGYGTEYTYNIANKLETVSDAETKAKGLSFTTKYGYDALGRTLTETAANGAVTKYSYDSAGNVISVAVRKTENAAEQTIKASTFDFTGNLLTETSYQAAATGSTITYEYNALGQVRKAIYPGDAAIPQNTVTCQYDLMGRLKTRQDTKGAIDTYTYSKQGNVLSHTQQKQDGTEAITTSTRYDKNGNARYVFDGNEKCTTYTYNEQNKVIISRQSASGIEHETTYTYDTNGNQITTTDWLGNTTVNVYDSLNRLIETKDAYGKSIQKLEYNHCNVQEKAYDALNKATVYTYDRNNRLLTATDPENHTTSQTYDNVGNIASKTDGRGNTTSYTYDEMGRLKTAVNAKNETTVYTYDLSGNLLTQTDGKGDTTTYEYNAANKAVKRIDHGGRTGPEGNYTYDSSKTEAYTYNADGSLASKTDRNGKTTVYTYDIHGRLISEEIQNEAGSAIAYAYDANGNQLAMTDSTGTTLRTYDELGRVLTKTVPNIGTTTFRYDIIEGMDEGCYKEITTDPKGNVTIKVFDKADRLITVTADGKTTTYGYYDNGARQSVAYSDGTNNIAVEEYIYYDNGLLWTLTNKKADGTVIDSYAYTYDAAGNQTSKTDSKGTTTYTYDELNRLKTVTEPDDTVTAYTFDGAGNRKTEAITKGTETTENTYTYNGQNRLTQISTKVNGTLTATTEYAYDSNGNQLTATVNGTITAVNVYDYRNQLIQTMTGTATTINAYNGEGYRVGKTVNGTLTRYLYEGDKVVLEVDSSGNETARNVYGSNLIMREAIRTDGSDIFDTYFYLYNGHADVTALLKPDGTIAATYYYDAFGNITDTTGSANNSIAFTGYQYDAETGLYYLNARMYDPKTARFLQEDTYLGDPSDPLSLNLYTYCHNEPIMYTDPTGHFDQLEAMARHASMLNTNSYFNGLISSGSTGASIAEHLKASQAAYNKDKLSRLIKDDKKIAERINSPKLSNTDNIASANEMNNGLPTALGIITGLTVSGIYNASLNIPEITNQMAFNQSSDEIMINALGQITGGNNHAYAGYYIGKTIGDAGSIVFGIGEAVLGAAGEVGGGILTASGVGAALGVPAIAASAGLIAHGVGTVGTSIYNVTTDAQNVKNYYNKIKEESPEGGSKPVVTQGKGQAPKQGQPNSVYEKVDNEDLNKVVSRTTYDSNGNIATREDYYTGSNPHTHYDKSTGQNLENHTHIYKYNDKGQRIGEEVVPLK